MSDSIQLPGGEPRQDPDDYVAWCRFTGKTIVTCDSDAPGAFKVYRISAINEKWAWLEFVAADRGVLAARVAELERLNLEAQHRIADLCVVVGNIEQCRSVEGDSVTILCDNPEADSIDTQGAVEASGDYTGYKAERFYGRNWEEALAKAARVSQRHYISDSDIYE